MSWIDTPTGKRCLTHDHDFARAEVCQRCVAGVGTPIRVVEDDTNEDDDELMARELDAYSLAKKCHRVGQELLDGTSRDVAAAAKAIAEGTKLIRLACELRDLRAARAHSRKLIEHERRMSGSRRG